jgi:flagellar hook assembly protein FlgD
VLNDLAIEGLVDEFDKLVGKQLAASDAGSLPESYALDQNHPNPFNPETEIRFQLPEANHVVVKIFDALGQEIRTLADGQYGAGYHSVRWDGKDHAGNPMSSGIYFYQLRVVDPLKGAGNFSQVKKMNLLK